MALSASSGWVGGAAAAELVTGHFPLLVVVGSLSEREKKKLYRSG
jgi:hypothetical protein